MQKQTLGEEKIGTCDVCHAQYHKTRFVQRFCSVGCKEKAKRIYKALRWDERKDREAQNAARKARYYRDRPEVLEKQRQWRRDFPELARIKDHAKYERNKAAALARAQKYRKEHPEVRRKEYHNSREKYPWKWALANAKHRSAKKKLAFDLTREWCERNWTGRCAVTNLPFERGTQNHYPFSVSVDRIDSSLGYLKTNCRFVLFAINSFKGVGNDEQMLTIAKAIINQNLAPATP